MYPSGSQFALAAFDSDRPLDRDTVARLERTLQISERWSLGSGVRLRAATVAEGPRGMVVVASIAGIPSGQGEARVSQLLDGALRQVARDIVNGVWVRNVALVALDNSQRPVADAAAVLRTLLEQVGDGHDRFGKILRLFLSAPSGGDPSPDDWMAAAARLRSRLQHHAGELKDTAMPMRFVGSQGAEAETGCGLMEVLDEADAAGTPTEEVRTLHRNLVASLERVMESQQSLANRLEELIRRPESTGRVADRLRSYCERALKPLAALERLIR